MSSAFKARQRRRGDDWCVLATHSSDRKYEAGKECLGCVQARYGRTLWRCGKARLRAGRQCLSGPGSTSSSLTLRSWVRTGRRGRSSTGRDSPGLGKAGFASLSQAVQFGTAQGLAGETMASKGAMRSRLSLSVSG